MNVDNNIKVYIDFGFGLNLMRTIWIMVENDNAFATPLQLVAQSPVTPVIDPETGEL